MLSISHLSFSYGKKEILNDITFDIAPGSFYAVLGANGSGKTTLLRCMAGLLKPQTGNVVIDQKPLDSYSIRQIAQKIAFVRQQPQTDIDFSAFETVLMGRNPYQRHLQNESQKDWDIVEQSMKQTNTWHLRMSLPSQMSGGELQRVMIARALAQQTPILLLDEPTSSLDIAHQLEIMELLSTINKEQNKTIIIVVHDLNLAMRYCPSTILLHGHKLMLQAPTKQALTPENISKVFNVQSQIIENHIII